MSDERQEWTPSPRERHFEWYLRLLMRYGVGGGGLTWALITNHLEPVLLMVLGATATSADVFSFAKGLMTAAREEEQSSKQSRHGSGR